MTWSTHSAVSMCRRARPSACVDAEAATAGWGCEARPPAGDCMLLAAEEATPAQAMCPSSMLLPSHIILSP